MSYPDSTQQKFNDLNDPNTSNRVGRLLWSLGGDMREKGGNYIKKGGNAIRVQN